MPTGDFYIETIFLRDPDEGDAQLLGNIEVTVTKPGGAPAQIYENEGLSVVKATPFVTADDGEISFWAPPGEYLIHAEDLESPPRIGPRDYAWMAIPYADYAALLPPGIIVPSARVTVPPNWLLCDGQEVSRSQYSRLFAAVGDVYGGGNGATTFNLPDFRGRAPWGVSGVVDSEFEFRGANDQRTPANRKTIHHHEMPTHFHTMQAHVHSMQSHAHGMSHSHYMHHSHGGGTSANAPNTTWAGYHAHSVGGGYDFTSDTRASGEGHLQALYVGGHTNQHITIDNNGNHQHGTDAHAHTIGTDAGTRDWVDGPQAVGGAAIPNTGGPSIANTGASSPANTSTDDPGDTFDTGLPFATVNYIIKT